MERPPRSRASRYSFASRSAMGGNVASADGVSAASTPVVIHPEVAREERLSELNRDANCFGPRVCGTCDLLWHLPSGKQKMPFDGLTVIAVHRSNDAHPYGLCQCASLQAVHHLPFASGEEVNGHTR